MPEFGAIPRRGAAIVLVAAFLAQIIHGLATKSGTCDELGAHVPSGILAWRSGQFSGGLANPPLGQLLVAAGPVLTGTADRPLDDSPRDLLPARIPVVLLGLVTVLATGVLARRLAGDVAGVAAIGLAALGPNVIAHSRLATLDLPVTALGTIACLSAWSWARTGARTALLGYAVAVGSAILVKFTALHLLIAIPVGALIAGPDRLRRPVALLGAGVLGAFILAWLGYGWHGGARLGWPAGLVEGLAQKWVHGRGGHFAYLLGERSNTGFPHYFLVALAVKLPLATQLAALVGGIALIRRRLPGDVRGFLGFAALPALWILAAVSLVHRVDIGVRHVLPVFPALLALGGAGWATLWNAGRPARVVAGVLAIAALATAVTTTPDHLAYFHRLAGGPERGDRILIDSNLDWGQDEGLFRSWASGRTVSVNPERPVDGLVAANVNAIRGILSADDSRLRWVTRLPREHTIGHTWRVFRVEESALAEAAGGDPVAALDYAWWLTGLGRADEALLLLEKHDLSGHPTHARAWWRARGEVALAAGDLGRAAIAAMRSEDPDLIAVVKWLGTSASENDAALSEPEIARVVGALVRRGDLERAHALANERLGPGVLALPADPGPADAHRLRALGLERLALAAAGQALARDPANEDLLWIYGELVVRRKLGLTEYPWPEVDWSEVRRTR